MDEVTEQKEFLKQVKRLIEKGRFYEEMYFELAEKYQKLNNTFSLKDAQIQDLTVLVKGLKRDIEYLEQGYKDILSWGSLGNSYSDISAAITFQDIARKYLAKHEGR